MAQHAAEPLLKPLALLVAVRLSLGVLYSVSVPIWEAYDEDGHFAYARYLGIYISANHDD